MAEAKRVLSMREGVAFGMLYTTTRQCGWKGCDSWRTVALECYEQDGEDGVNPVSRALCLEHLPEFIDRHILRNHAQVYEADLNSPEFEAEPEEEDEIVPDL